MGVNFNLVYYITGSQAKIIFCNPIMQFLRRKSSMCEATDLQHCGWYRKNKAC